MTSDISVYIDQVDEAVAFLRKFISAPPEIAIQLGTGLGSLARQVTVTQSIDYADIPFFPRSTVSSHEGRLIIGLLNNVPVIILSGRFHYYEGYDTRQVTFPIRVIRGLGARTLILTNAAGGLNPLFLPGTIMVIRDHLNFLGENPLRGPNVDAWGPRFPDLSHAYPPDLIRTALDCADNSGIKNVVTGIYVCIPGPSLETPAETRWLMDAGGDAVGMSSVPEVIVAVHGGMQVVGLSVIANVNNPDNMQPISLEQIIETASAAEPRLELLVVELISRITAEHG
ncbi:MAG: purine-nucleoside phosphorylase [Desulfocapsaceae bacterium]|jgi:purine-nucleoside phosphorylase|nr:purine-nucleoside phosphorylase [Desulfocapsaceae bacterium]